ncbi:Sialic acid transporter NanT [Sodalis praecaptivus]
MLFGHFGDRVGRKITLMMTLMIMGIGTLLIGLIPPYAQIGVWAPVALVLLRCLQGIGIGGEYGGGMTMVVEHSPPGRRGFYSALMHIGVPAGFLLPIIAITLLNAFLDEWAFLSWGWRIPFLFSVVLLGIGLFIRSQISETPAFKKSSAREARPAYLCSRRCGTISQPSCWVSAPKLPKVVCLIFTPCSPSAIASMCYPCRAR